MRAERILILITTVFLLLINTFGAFTMINYTERLVRSTEPTGAATGTVSFCSLGGAALTSITDKSVSSGTQFSYQVNCSQDCGETLSFNFTVSPDLPVFDMDKTTGQINFTPFSSNAGTYTVNISCNKTNFAQNTTSFLLTVDSRIPNGVQIFVNEDNSSINLSWLNVPNTDYYNVYYSSNISSIINLDLNSISDNVTKITNITQTNWTDWNASETQKRYYRITAVNGTIESMANDTTVVKFTYYLDAPLSTQYGTLASNRISIYLNKSYTAESFLQELPASLNPTISKLDKSNASGEFLTTHSRGINDNNNFTLETTRGYQLSVDADYNFTIVGQVHDTGFGSAGYYANYTTLNSTKYGTLATNWRGVFDFKSKYFADNFLLEIPGTFNPTIAKLDKTNASGEFLTTHARGIDDNNNFTVEKGISYAITVDKEYVHTFCTTCFK
jgi:hypothetical protein